MYLSDAGQQIQIHEHPTDQTCHWIHVLKPLAFITYRDARLAQDLVRSAYYDGKELNASDPSAYARWICSSGENGILNLLNVFFIAYDLRGPPLPSYNAT